MGESGQGGGGRGAGQDQGCVARYDRGGEEEEIGVWGGAEGVYGVHSQIANKEIAVTEEDHRLKPVTIQ